MTTIPALHELQQKAPETTLVSLNTHFQGFCTVNIQPPDFIRDYFVDFLQKAEDCTDGNTCKIALYSDGRISIELVLPNRRYCIKSTDSTPEEKLQ